MTAIEVRGVVAGYGDRVVLRGCDLAVARGELVSVIGPNGAGKSTLVRVLAGLLRPRAGEVRLGGAAIAALSRAEIARLVAVVPQSIETLFPFTARELVALGRTARLDVLGRASGDDRAAIARAMDELQLAPLGDRRVDGLSGGERQRVVLAMALAQETPILLLDEPTVHLDPRHQLATMALLRRLAAGRRMAVLTVVHDLNLAALADRVVVLDDGRVVREGAPAAAMDDALVRAVFGPGWRVVLHEGRPVVLP